MKLTVLGGGGVRSAFLAKSLAYNAHRIGLTEVVFLDSSCLLYTSPSPRDS